MWVQFCDRCGKRTNNRAAFLLPITDENDYEYSCNGTKFGSNTVTLCDECLDEFKKFRYNHEKYNTELE